MIRQDYKPIVTMESNALTGLGRLPRKLFDITLGIIAIVLVSIIFGLEWRV